MVLAGGGLHPDAVLYLREAVEIMRGELNRLRAAPLRSAIGQLEAARNEMIEL